MVQITVAPLAVSIGDRQRKLVAGRNLLCFTSLSSSLSVSYYICVIMLIIIISSLLNYILIITIHFVFIGIFISGRSYNFSCAAQVVLLAPTEALYF